VSASWATTLADARPDAVAAGSVAVDVFGDPGSQKVYDGAGRLVGGGHVFTTVRCRTNAAAAPGSGHRTAYPLALAQKGRSDRTSMCPSGDGTPRHQMEHQPPQIDLPQKLN